MDANSYRRLAAEHQRKAEVALALAHEQEQRNRELQRQLALDRLRNELSLQHVTHPAIVSEDGVAPARRAPLHPYSPIESVEARHRAPLPAYAEPQQRHRTLEDEIRGFLQRREQEQEEVLRAAQRNRMNNASINIEAPRPQKSRTTVPAFVNVERRTPSPTRQNDLATSLRNALSGGRSEEEKDAILRELGLAPSVKSAPQPRLASTHETTSKPVPSPKPVFVPGTGASTTTTSSAGTPAPRLSQPVSSTTTISSPSLASLDAIQTAFDTLKADFVFPGAVEFSDSTTSTIQGEGPTPKLLYNRANAPLLHYESELIKLLTKLDAVESGGAESVRGARKALVLAIEKELDELEGAKNAAWARKKDEESVTPATTYPGAGDAAGAAEKHVEDDLVQVAESTPKMEAEEVQAAEAPSVPVDVLETESPIVVVVPTEPQDEEDSAAKSPIIEAVQLEGPKDESLSDANAGFRLPDAVLYDLTATDAASREGSVPHDEEPNPVVEHIAPTREQKAEGVHHPVTVTEENDEGDDDDESKTVRLPQRGSDWVRVHVD